MPARIETIDAIARRLGRDVIFLDIRNGEDRPVRDRQEIAAATTWLDAERIGWTVCLGFAPGMLLIEGGPRAIYIEAPFEPGSETLAKLESRFETPDGYPLHPDLILTLLAFEDAMINEEQDTAGFWDNI
jgi:hypothetical protein